MQSRSDKLKNYRSLHFIDNKKYLGAFVTSALAILLSIVVVKNAEMAIAILFCIPILFIIKKKPEIGLILILIILSSIVFREALPLISVGIGSFHITDVILIYLLILTLVNRSSKKNAIKGRDTFGLFLIFFVLASIIAFFNGVVMKGVDFNEGIRVLRPYVYSLLYFVVVELIRSRRQVECLINGIFLVGIVVGTAMVIQAFIGDSISIMPGRIEAAGTFGEDVGQATRVLPPGQGLIYVSLIMSGSAIGLSMRNRSSVWLFLTFMISGFGVLLTYNRSYWVTIIIVFFSFYMFGGIKNKGQLIVRGILPWLVIGGTFILITIAYPSGSVGNYYESFRTRMVSLFQGEELYDSGSIQYRVDETKDAIASVIKNPLFGIGFGSNYRQLRNEAFEGLQDYCHNGYLGILVKMGFVGLIPFVIMLLAFFAKTFRSVANIRDSYFRALLLGAVLSVLGFAIINIVNPVFMQWKSMVVIFIILGLAEVLSSDSLYSEGSPDPVSDPFIV